MVPVLNQICPSGRVDVTASVQERARARARAQQRRGNHLGGTPWRFFVMSRVTSLSLAYERSPSTSANMFNESQSGEAKVGPRVNATAVEYSVEGWRSNAEIVDIDA